MHNDLYLIQSFDMSENDYLTTGTTNKEDETPFDMVEYYYIKLANGLRRSVGYDYKKALNELYIANSYGKRYGAKIETVLVKR